MPGRLLIAAGESASGSAELPFGIEQLIEAADEILVVAPSLPSRFEWLASATDRSREQADERLGVVLDHLDGVEAPVTGRVGADDPLVALEDAIAEFRPDHLLIAVRSGERSDWQERGLLDAIHRRFGLPLSIFSPS
jgi:GABA permease